MKISLLVCYLWLSAGLCQIPKSCNISHVDNLMNAILKSLHYADVMKTQLNLDGIMGIRLTSDQLQVLSEYLTPRNFEGKFQILQRLDYLVNLSNNVANVGIESLKTSESDYFQRLGNLLYPGSWRLNYFNERHVDRRLQKTPLLCEEIQWSENQSDICISELLGMNPENPIQTCLPSSNCVAEMLSPGYKGYSLTHQVLYLQIAEMKGCLNSVKSYGYTDADILQMQDEFCANVLRDAEETAEYNYPESSRDLFLEQIGLCGMYGYWDFWRDDWTYHTFQWQQANGCFLRSKKWKCKDSFSDGSNRIKRTDKVLDKYGCSSHKTAVALSALTVNLRFCLLQRLANEENGL